MRRILLPATLVLASTTICFGQRQVDSSYAVPDYSEIARAAISDDPATSQHAIDALRARGPAGLQSLLSTHAELIAKHKAVATNFAAGSAKDSDPTWERLKTALDQVSGQRDCRASRLFWYTDIEQAKAAAEREHKPILSLRLLGKLTDEYSCANSRFFRTTLYANDAVSQVLRDRFILHWKSVRPVPKVTIDFGDGRKLERTLTGNSIHYVLDSEGRVIDALPGLYGPKPFLRELERAEKIIEQTAALPPIERERALMAYHRERATAIHAAWQDDLRKLGIQAAGYETVQPHFMAGQPQVAQKSAAAPSAAKAGPAALSKWAIEAPMVAAVDPAPTAEEATSDPVWNRIAALHADDGALDAASVALIASQHPTAAAAARLAASKSFVENPLVRMVRTFQGSIALDTVRNEYLLHRQIHQWLAAGSMTNLDMLNNRVYADLFLTPNSDPWLGLMPADTYTALENNGVVKQTVK
jgi:hypothetical protein